LRNSQQIQNGNIIVYKYQLLGV